MQGPLRSHRGHRVARERNHAVVTCERFFSDHRVSVMEGGFPAWKALGLPLESSPVPDDVVTAPAQAARSATSSSKSVYTAKLDKSKVISLHLP